MPDGLDNLDVLVICLGLVVILGGTLFGAGRARAPRGPRHSTLALSRRGWSGACPPY